jgi:serine/threonine protein phosphatase PrpC
VKHDADHLLTFFKTMLRPKARKALHPIENHHDPLVQRKKRTTGSRNTGSRYRFTASIMILGTIGVGVVAILLWMPRKSSLIPLPVVVLRMRGLRLPFHGNRRESENDPKPLAPTLNVRTAGDLCHEYGCPQYPSEYDSVHDAIETIRGTSLDQLRPEDFHMAMLTRQSNRPKPPINQDKAVLIRPFRTKQTTDQQDFFMAIFDGHGGQGHHVSKYAAKAVPEILANKFNSFLRRGENNETTDIMTENDIREALNATMVEVDVQAPPIGAMRGGTTASVTLRRGGKLYFANVGDSRTIVVSVEQQQHDKITVGIPFSTRLDKPYLPDEKARIERMGGTIKYPKDKPLQSRVWAYSSLDGETMGLAMSRSIGDWEWGAIGVTAEPLINVLDVSDFSNAFVLAASDGMWDIRKPQFFANQFAASLLQRLKHPFLTCYEVVEKVSPKNNSTYRDDISMIAMKLVP